MKIPFLSSTLILAFLLNTNAFCADSFNFTTPVGLAGYAGNPLTGNGDGTNNGARFYSPVGIAADATGKLFVCDGHTLRLITRSGANWIVTTMAGLSSAHGTNDGNGSAARFNNPNGVAVDSAGNVFVADTYNDTIRKVSLSGTNWAVTTIAGFGMSAGSANGTNTDARFNNPYDLALNTVGELFVADAANNTIRKVSASGANWIVTTIAGNPGSVGVADGTNNNSRFNAPAAVAVDAATNIYVADYNNNTIRRITAFGTNWVVSTIAGSTNGPGSIDGTNTSARFNQPQGLAVDAFGNVYVSDSGNTLIRRIQPVGVNYIVTTLAGSTLGPGSANGIGSAARFDLPDGIAVDSSGILYVVDVHNTSYGYTVRRGEIAILLSAAVAGNKLILSWPLGATGYVAETRVSLSSSTWTPQTNPVFSAWNGYWLTNGSTGSASFFRLHKP